MIIVNNDNPIAQMSDDELMNYVRKHISGTPVDRVYIRKGGINGEEIVFEASELQ